MRTSRRLVASGVAVLFIASLALTAPTASAAMDRPTWAAGDFWVYGFTSDLAGTPTNGTLRMDVTGTESVSVNGTSYSTYHTTASLTIPFGGSLVFIVPAEIWFSTDTLAIVKITADVNITFGFFTIDATFTISGNPPQTIQWPLTTGASWTSSTTVWTVTTNSTGATTYLSAPLSTDFEVQAEATITVPIGTFTTTPLKETETVSGNYTINYWSPQVGNWARVGTYNSTGREEGGFNLTAYRYQGGSFFTSIFFGLPVYIWLILLAIILVAVVSIFVLRRRKPPAMPQPMPPQMPPQEPPMGPEGPPPGFEP